MPPVREDGCVESKLPRDAAAPSAPSAAAAAAALLEGSSGRGVRSCRCVTVTRDGCLVGVGLMAARAAGAVLASVALAGWRMGLVSSRAAIGLLASWTCSLCCRQRASSRLML